MLSVSMQPTFYGDEWVARCWAVIWPLYSFNFLISPVLDTEKSLFTVFNYVLSIFHVFSCYTRREFGFGPRLGLICLLGFKLRRMKERGERQFQCSVYILFYISWRCWSFLYHLMLRRVSYYIQGGES